MKQDNIKIPKFIQGFMAPTDGKILGKKNELRHVELVIIKN